jgi:hypothetical protein
MKHMVLCFVMGFACAALGVGIALIVVYLYALREVAL